MAVAVVATMSTMIAAMVTTMVLIATACFIAMERVSMIVAMELAVFAAVWQRAMISMMRIVAVIYVTMPARTTVVPRTRSDEDAIIEPLGPVVTIRSAIVRGIIKVSIGTNRGRSHIDAEAERNLGFCR